MNILLARIGWMKYYNGIQKGDERPIGGGKFNKKNIGGEYCNFKTYKNKTYGFFSTSTQNFDIINLSRINPNFEGDQLKNVLLIFISKHPNIELGQVVIGWYKNATLLQESDYNEILDTPYFAIANSKNATLLPTSKRTINIPRGSNTPGQSNTFYIYDNKGKKKSTPWLKKVLSFIENYEGDNLVTSPEAELQDYVESEYQESLGQGFKLDPKARKAIEDRSMNAAIRFYRTKGFDVEDVSRTKSYDLMCKKNSRTIFVEVKGSQHILDKIILTPNEVKLAKKNRGKMNLFLLHSIKLSKRGKKYITRGV